MTTIDRSLETLTSDVLAAPGIRHAFFTRRGGVSGGIYGSLNAGLGSRDERGAVSENCARIAAHMGVPAHALVSMNQTHSADVLTIDDTVPDRPKVDALVTDRPGIALGVLTADCGPLVFSDPAARVIGVAHAGWRGATGGIIEATLEAMEALGATASDVRAVLGPTIGPASYEVGPEFVENVRAITPSAAGLFRPSGNAGHSLFDLPAYIVGRCKEAGIGAVADLAHDTYADEARFFSYRRATHRGEPDYGRLLSAITLEG